MKLNRLLRRECGGGIILLPGGEAFRYKKRGGVGEL